MVQLLRRTLGEHVEIEAVGGGGLWQARSTAQLEKALLNLAINARDAMPDGGKLTIETGNAYLDDDYARPEPRGVRRASTCMLAVTDTGTGMTPEVLDRAFEPFFTHQGGGQGTGLGLSQVYGFIKQSGGHVKIYSELGTARPCRSTCRASRARCGRGTAAAGAASRRHARRDAAGGGGRRRRAALVVAELGDLGYRITRRDSGEAALAVLA